MPEGRRKKGYTHRCVLKVRVRHLAPKSQSPSPLQQYNLTQNSRRQLEKWGCTQRAKPLGAQYPLSRHHPTKNPKGCGEKEGCRKTRFAERQQLPKSCCYVATVKKDRSEGAARVSDPEVSPTKAREICEPVPKKEASKRGGGQWWCLHVRRLCEGDDLSLRPT